MKEGMKMPGFSAESSLYKPRRHYNLGVNRGVDGQVVIPQLPMPPMGCYLTKCRNPNSWSGWSLCMRCDSDSDVEPDDRW